MNIPTHYPAHTRTFLAHIDAVVTERAKAERTTKAAEAARLLNHAEGNTAYFAGLYVELLTRSSTSSTSIRR